MFKAGDFINYNGKKAEIKAINENMNLAQIEVDTGIIVYRSVSDLKGGMVKYNNTTNEAGNSALNQQTGGSHYKDLEIQPIEYITKNNLSFNQGNVIKYITRYKNKNGIEDLKKAKHMIDLMIQLEYGE